MTLEGPFRDLIIGQDPKLHGCAWIFHLSSKGNVSGLCILPGTTILGRRDTGPYSDIFFLECQNTQTFKSGI